MQVKELWAYREATDKVRRALDDLYEYENKIYSPSGARADGMPFEAAADNDRLAPIAQKHAELRERLSDARLQAHNAYIMLERFEDTLSPEESDVLDLRYRKGFTLRQMEVELHRCERTLRRINNRIKEKFRKF